MDPNQTQNTLLIVDDEPDLIELFVEQLSELNLKILTANNGIEALKIITENSKSIDTVLSDLNMPQMTGLQLLSKVRTQGLDVPFVFITGYGDKEKAIEALKLGAMDFLSKPYEIDNFVKVIDKSVEYGAALRVFNEEINLILEQKALPSQNVERLRLAQEKIITIKKQINFRNFQFGS